MTRAFVVCAYIAWLGLSACGDSATRCPNDLPAACPDPAPTWDGGVSAIVAARCAGCHAPGERAPEKPFTTFDEVYAIRRGVLTQVFACRMPPDDGEPLSAVERATLLAWLVCGAPRE